MTKQQNEMSAKAEVIMMGIMQPVYSKEEVIFILDYIAKTLKQSFSGEEVYADATRYGEGHNIRYIHIGTLEDMIMIALPMTTSEDEDPDKFDIASPNGMLSYVYNATYPDLSELGYCFFAKNEQGILEREG